MSSNEKTPKSQYTDGETVLCYHGPLLYEAKCIKSDLKNKSPQYLIHYSGWNKSWDEWVPCPRVLKFSEENLKKQQELLATHGTSKIITKIKSNSRKSMVNVSTTSLSGDGEKTSDDKIVSGRPGSTPTSTSAANISIASSDSRKKKYRVEETVEPTDDYVIRNEIKLEFSEDLKQILNEDYENVCINKKMVDLPANKTIAMILDDYVAYKVEKKNDKNVITEIAEGLKDYFNTSLPTKLLYNSERLQYNEAVVNANKKPYEVYGIIHFLRLFVKIGQLLSYTYWDEISIKQMTLHLEDVLRFLIENKEKLFNSKNYIVSSTTNKQIKDEKK